MKNYREELGKINYLTTEIDALYHLSSIKFGISDSENMILYCVLDGKGECSLSEIYKMSGISKQTINSAIRNLEKKEYIDLEQVDGKSKKVVFTKKGKDFAEKTVAKLFDAESAAFKDWSEEDVNNYIQLTEKYLQAFKTEIEKL